MGNVLHAAHQRQGIAAHAQDLIGGNSKMQHGGKRASSGRPSLHNTAKCRWIVKRVREIIDTPEQFQKRKTLYIKRNQFKRVEQYKELKDAYDELGNMEQPQRAAVVNDEFGTPLEDTRAIIEDNFPQYLLPLLNQFQKKDIYIQVAVEATAKFGRLTTHRNVKDCMQAWANFEKSVHRSD